MIAKQAKHHDVARLCEVMGVSRSSYYAWRRRAKSERQAADHALQVEIGMVHTRSRGRYGVRKVRHALARQGQRVSHKRVARLMRESGLKSRRARRFTPTTTDSKHNLPIAPNVLQRDFSAQQPNTKWVSDITFVPTAEGWLYLAVVLDLFSRRAVGWSIGEHMTRQLVMRAFDMATQTRSIQAGLVFHSDQGSQFASDDFVDLIGLFEVTQSMSRKAQCLDNAVMESFFASYKAECLPESGAFTTHAQATSETFEYIEVFYNRQRYHSTLNYATPVEHERLHAGLS
jgi:transposase InsO family protein